MGFKTQDGFQFTGSGDGLKYVSGKRISFYISEQGDVGSGDAGGYNGTSGIVTTNIVLDLNATNSSSYGGSGTTWSDISGNSNNGTLVNGVTYNSGDGGYFIFDGTNDAATVPVGSDFVYGTGDFTVEIWFNVTGTSPAAYGEILYAQQGPSHNYFLVVSSENSPVEKKPGFIFGTGGGGTKTLSSTTYTEGVWHHFVATRNGTGVTLYLDNNSVGTVTCSQDFNNTTYVPTIGSNSQQSFGYFDGKISQVRVYKGKGFSASEVVQNYLATGSNYFGDIVTTNLVLNLDASNNMSYLGSGTTWTDISGQGNNGTLENGVSYSSTDGGYLIFDGSDDFVSFTDSSDFAVGTGDFTSESWVQLNNSSGFVRLLTVVNPSNASNTYTFTLKNTEIYLFSDGINGYALRVQSLTNNVSTWYHIVFSRISGTLKLYINAVEAGSTSFTENITWQGLLIGKNKSGSSFSNANHAQSRLYKGTGLTASEVLQNYLATGSNYFGNIITTGLVLHLDASNNMSYSGSGTTWTDISGQGNDGTLVNGVTYNSGDGGYLIFDGTNDKVTLPAGSDFAYGTGDFTIEMWFNVTGTSPQNYGEVLFGQTASGTNYLLLSSSHGVNPNIIKKPLFTHSGTNIQTSTAYTEGTWHHIVVTRNGTTGTVYLDNSSVGSESVTDDYNNTTYVPTIAAYTQTNSYNFDGKISQVRIYKGKGFSASDVAQNYNATKDNYVASLITTNLVVYLDAGNSSSYSGSGTAWNDLSGNGNNFTLTNGPTYTSSDGGAIVFDGTNDYAVSATNASFFAFGTSNDYSYGAWVKVDTTGQNESIFSCATGQGGVTVNSFQLDFENASGRIRHVFRHPSGQAISYTSTDVGTGWFYVMVVNDRSEDELKMYINGSLIDTESDIAFGTDTDVHNFSSSSDSNGTFRIGTNRGIASFIDGSIAQVHIYKGKALTASEVLQNYNATKATYGY